MGPSDENHNAGAQKAGSDDQPYEAHQDLTTRPVRYGYLFNFPKYTTSPSAYSAARAKLGQAIENALAKAAPLQEAPSQPVFP